MQMNAIDVFKKLSDAQKESDYIKGLVIKDHLMKQFQPGFYFDKISQIVIGVVQQFNVTPEEAQEYVMGVKVQLDSLEHTFQMKAASVNGGNPNLKPQIQEFLLQKMLADGSSQKFRSGLQTREEIASHFGLPVAVTAPIAVEVMQRLDHLGSIYVHDAEVLKQQQEAVGKQVASN